MMLHLTIASHRCSRIRKFHEPYAGVVQFVVIREHDKLLRHLPRC